MALRDRVAITLKTAPSLVGKSVLRPGWMVLGCRWQHGMKGCDRDLFFPAIEGSGLPRFCRVHLSAEEKQEYAEVLEAGFWRYGPPY